MNALKHLIYRVFHGWNSLYPPLTAKDVRDGSVPPIWRIWLAQLQQDVGTKVTVFYAKPYSYTDQFEELATRVVIVEVIPGNPAARGTAARLVDGTTTLTLTTRSMNDRVYVQHEMLHLMQYKHPELFGPSGKAGEFAGDHWPLIFYNYGAH